MIAGGKLIISAGPQQGPESPDSDEDEDLHVPAEYRAWQCSDVLHGARLDRVLVEQVPEFSRSYLSQLVSAGAVRVGGMIVRKPSAKVRAGDVGTIELRPTPQSRAFQPEAMRLDIVFEDDHLVVINKPAGLVVHPAPGNWSGTLLNGLLARDPACHDLPRAGIVHRLDKDTSGLMVVARSRLAMEALVRMISAREVHRQYVALAHRAWHGPAAREVHAPIGRDPRNRLRMAAVDLDKNGGKPASTLIELLQNAEQGCWVLCTLRTGRTHQIRVHLSSIGHPLVADAVYGGAPAAGLQRQALHAFRLAFRHPVTRDPVEFHAPLPEDLRSALQLWGLRYNEMHCPVGRVDGQSATADLTGKRGVHGP